MSWDSLTNEEILAIRKLAHLSGQLEDSAVAMEMRELFHKLGFHVGPRKPPSLKPYFSGRSSGHGGG